MTWLMISQVRQSLKIVLGLLVNKNKALGLSIFVLAMRGYVMVVVFPGGMFCVMGTKQMLRMSASCLQGVQWTVQPNCAVLQGV